MEEYSIHRDPQKCLWYDECKCLITCEHFYSIDEDITDEELLERKYAYREEFFEYAEEYEIFDC